MAIVAIPNENSAASSGAPQIVADVVARCHQIATLNPIARKVLQLTNNLDSSFDELDRVVQSDPAFAMRVLKIANSSFYGRSGQIGSVPQAIAMLGFQAVKNLAIATGLNRFFQSRFTKYGFSAASLWMHSLAVACAARSIAKCTKTVCPEEAFVGGLIHDIGIIVELQIEGAKFTEVLRLVSTDEILTFRDAEIQILGASHEAFGAALCASWKFPSSLQLAVGYHHRPLEVRDNSNVLPAIIYVADVLAARGKIGYTNTIEDREVSAQIRDLLSASDADLTALSDDLPVATKEMGTLLQIH